MGSDAGRRPRLPRSPAGRAWDRVVVADAVDVIPSSATASTESSSAPSSSSAPATSLPSSAERRRAGSARRASTPVFDGGARSQATLRAATPSFSNSGQLAGEVARRCLAMARRLRVAGHASSSAPPPAALAALWPQNGAAGLDDQGSPPRVLDAAGRRRCASTAAACSSATWRDGICCGVRSVSTAARRSGAPPCRRASASTRRASGLPTARATTATTRSTPTGFRRDDCAGGGRRGLGCGADAVQKTGTRRCGRCSAGTAPATAGACSSARCGIGSAPTDGPPPPRRPTSAGPSWACARSQTRARATALRGFGARGPPPTMASAPCGSARRSQRSARAAHSRPSPQSRTTARGRTSAPARRSSPPTPPPPSGSISVAAANATRAPAMPNWRTATAWCAGRASAAWRARGGACGVQLPRWRPAHSTICAATAADAPGRSR